MARCRRHLALAHLIAFPRLERSRVKTSDQASIHGEATMRRKARRSLRTSSPALRRVFRQALSQLEAWALLSGNPTYYTVNLTSDTGASSGTDALTGYPSGDLLWAINQANNQGQPGYAAANSAGSVIDFDPSVFSTAQTVALSSTLVLSESDGPETIQGPGSALVTISGNNAVGVFLVDSGVTAGVSALTISGGTASSGGAIDNKFISDPPGALERRFDLSIVIPIEIDRAEVAEHHLVVLVVDAA